MWIRANKEQCNVCKGTGEVKYPGNKVGIHVPDYVPCWQCNGAGKVYVVSCPVVVKNMNL